MDDIISTLLTVFTILTVVAGAAILFAILIELWRDL